MGHGATALCALGDDLRLAREFLAGKMGTYVAERMRTVVAAKRCSVSWAGTRTWSYNWGGIVSYDVISANDSLELLSAFRKRLRPLQLQPRPL